jgi:hypothetical protein
MNEITTIGPGDLLTAKEVGAILRCSVDRVHRLFHAGLLRGFDMAGERRGGGRRVRLFLRASVCQYVSHALEASAAARAERARK